MSRAFLRITGNLRRRTGRLIYRTCWRPKKQNVFGLKVDVSVLFLPLAAVNILGIGYYFTSQRRFSPDVLPHFEIGGICIENTSFAKYPELRTRIRALNKNENNLDRNRLIVITPTYNRSTQIPDLIRMKQTLDLVPNTDWIVIEDAAQINPHVFEYIKSYRSGRLYYSASPSDKGSKLKGRIQRNMGLKLIETLYHNYQSNGSSNPYNNSVIYFGDDDNSYDANFLNLLRTTKRVSLFNVGLIGGAQFEGPIVQNNTIVWFKTRWLGYRKFPVDMARFSVNFNFYASRNLPRFEAATAIVGFKTPWLGYRKFPVDMAGFAVNFNFYAARNFPRFEAVTASHQESKFLSSLKLKATEMEYKHGEQGIHVWHTQTTRVTKTKKIREEYYNGTSDQLYRKSITKGVNKPLSNLQQLPKTI